MYLHLIMSNDFVILAATHHIRKMVRLSPVPPVSKYNCSRQTTCESKDFVFLTFIQLAIRKESHVFTRNRQSTTWTLRDFVIKVGR